MIGRRVTRLVAGCTLAAVVLAGVPAAAVGPARAGSRGQEMWLLRLAGWIDNLWGDFATPNGDHGIDIDPNG